MRTGAEFFVSPIGLRLLCGVEVWIFGTGACDAVLFSERKVRRWLLSPGVYIDGTHCVTKLCPEVREW